MGDLVWAEDLDVLLLHEANPRAVSVLQEIAGLDWVHTAYDTGAQRAGRAGPRLAAVAGGGRSLSG